MQVILCAVVASISFPNCKPPLRLLAVLSSFQTLPPYYLWCLHEHKQTVWPFG